jgi:CBS domain-containing protein
MPHLAEEVMTRTPLYLVTPDMPLNRVLAAMLETGSKSFPVLDGDRLVGMISRADVVRALRAAAAGEPPRRDPSGV